MEAHAREESTSDEFQKNVQLKSAQPRKRKRQKRLTLQKSKKRQLTNNRSRPSETKSQDADETQDFNRKEPVMTMEKLLSKKKKSLDNLPVVEFDDMSYLETDVDETENVAQQNKRYICFALVCVMLTLLRGSSIDMSRKTYFLFTFPSTLITHFLSVYFQ